MSKTIRDRGIELYSHEIYSAFPELAERGRNHFDAYTQGATEQRTIDEKELQPKWIPVDERLPDNDVEVVVLWDGMPEFGLHCDDGWYSAKDMKLKNITHWMPMPPLPSGAKL